MANYKVAIDAGHGGSDSGAAYQNRREKDDVLRLAYAVGSLLEQNGMDVFYVREGDEYETPFKKATDANNANADLFVSIHRNSSETPNQYTGVETLVFNDSGMKAELARNINAELANLGFKNLGVDERPNLVVLKRTRMPAVMIEAGFINNDSDNALFDQQFDQIAQGIADAIVNTVYGTTTANAVEQRPTWPGNPPFVVVPPGGMRPDNPQSPNQPMQPNPPMPPMQPNPPMPPMPSNPPQRPEPMPPQAEEEGPERLYRVQVGAFRNRESADRLLNSLQIEGFPAFIVFDGGLYKVQVGAFRFLANAIKMEERLRRFRYNTYITT